MRHILLSVVSVALCCVAVFTSCSHQDEGEAAAQAAKEYYQYLVDGKYDKYVAALSRADSLSASYRSQLTANAKMFMAQQKEEHRGIREVRAFGGQADEAGQTAQAFLVLCYGDSTNEEICIPMVKRGKKWMLK